MTEYLMRNVFEGFAASMKALQRKGQSQLSRQSSIARDYKRISFAVFVLMLLVSCLLSWRAHVTHRELVSQRLQSQAERVDRTLTDTLDYGFALLDTVSEQVSYAQKESSVVFWLLSSFKEEMYKFGWVDEQKKLRVGSISGIMNPPIDLSDRAYITKAYADPKIATMGDPVTTKRTRRVIIPLSKGVYDKGGAFMGVVTNYVSLNGLTQKLEPIAQLDGISLTILSETREPLIQLPNQTSFQPPAEKELREGGNSFFAKSGKYPFLILLRYDEALAAKELQGVLYPQLLGVFVLGGFLISLLYLFHRRIVAPVVQLSQTAVGITQGKMDIHVPENGSQEIEHLGQQLQNVVRHIRENDLIKQSLRDKAHQLERANSALTFAKEQAEESRQEAEIAQAEALKAKVEAEEANNAKSEFLASMSHELRTPLNAVIAFSEAMNCELFGPMKNEKYKEYAGDIHASGTHLLHLVNDLLDLSKAQAGMIELNQQDVNVDCPKWRVVRLCPTSRASCACCARSNARRR